MKVPSGQRAVPAACRIRVGLFVLAVTVTLTACAQATSRFLWGLEVMPQSAVLIASDVTIRAIEGDWAAQPNQAVSVPDGWRNRATGWVDTRSGRQYLGCETELLGAYDTYRPYTTGGHVPLRYGRVTVAHEPSGDYYGIMTFFRVAASSNEVARRRWTIRIPTQYFTAARANGLSVVYGTYSASQDDVTHVCQVDNTVQPVSWVLWLSDAPLW